MSGTGTLQLHLAKEPGQWSIHKPNIEFIQKFETHHWSERKTNSVVSVKSISLDECLDKESLGCDFLKIDTHGSEFQILIGAQKALKRDIVAVLLETWTTEVHQGQPLSGEILVHMKKAAFELFDLGIATSWRNTLQLLKIFLERQGLLSSIFCSLKNRMELKADPLGF